MTLLVVLSVDKKSTAMLLVLPFSHPDAKLAVSLAKYLELVGPYKSHNLLIATPEDCQPYANQVLEAIGDQFAKTDCLYLKNHKDGWPIGVNMMFHSVAYYIWQNVDCECFYFFEPDNTPVKPSWLNTIYDEYRRVQRPFFGFINTTYWQRKDGTHYQDGTHLIGTSIYPKDCPRYSKLFPTIPFAAVPWDVYWQWEIVKYAASTNLIHHEWRTWKYKRDKETGEIIGEHTPGERLPYVPKPLSSDAVVLHGCKDGSAMAIMREIIQSRKQPAESMVGGTV